MGFNSAFKGLIGITPIRITVEGMNSQYFNFNYLGIKRLISLGRLIIFRYECKKLTKLQGLAKL
jgi:hypothetical protein